MARLPKTKLYIGTSGWMYKDWGAMFYPKDMKTGFLTYLANEFNTVEVNSSFYHLPLATTFAKWRGETPDNFVFAVKLSRFITHRKRLKGVGRELNTFLTRARKLGPKSGVILVQLPPFLKYDKKLFKNFVNLLAKKKVRFALEPRHASWFDISYRSEILAALNKAGVALVFPHSAKIPSPDPDDAANITSDFIYVRFHGPSEWAASRYGPERLKPWAGRIKKWCAKGLDVFIYFNNDIHGHAIVDARTLKKLVG